MIIIERKNRGKPRFFLFFLGLVWYNKTNYCLILMGERGGFVIILGLDPGYAIVGYGVVQAQNSRYRSLEHGAIVTKAGEPFERRLEIIYDALSSVLAKWKPESMALEKLYFSNNKTTAIGVAEARGVILLAARKAGVPVFEYTPMQVKIAVTGYGGAKKPQVMEMTRRLLCLQEVPKPDDTADALGMAIAHCHCSRSRLMGTPLR